MKKFLVNLSTILIVSQFCFCNVLNFNHPPYAEDNEQIESQQQQQIKQVRWQEKVLEDIKDISTTKEELLIAIPSRSQDTTYTSLKTRDEVQVKSVADIPIPVLYNNAPEIQRSEKSLEPTPVNDLQKRTRRIKKRRRPQKVKEESNVDGKLDTLKQNVTLESTVNGQLRNNNVDNSDIKAGQYSHAYTEINRVKTAPTEIPKIINNTTVNSEFDNKPTPTEKSIDLTSKPNTVNRGLRRHRTKVSTENISTQVVEDDVSVSRTSNLRRISNRRRYRPETTEEKKQTSEIHSTTKLPETKRNPSENSNFQEKSSSLNPYSTNEDAKIPVLEKITSTLNSKDVSSTANLNYENKQSYYETTKFESTQTPIETVPQTLVQDTYNVHYTVNLPEINPVHNSDKESVSSFESNSFKYNQLTRNREADSNSAQKLTSNNNDKIHREDSNVTDQQNQNIGTLQSRFKEDPTPIVQLAKEDSRQTIRNRNPVKIIESKSYVYGDTGDFHFSFEDEDGTKKFENGKLKRFDDDVTGESVSGGYSYKDKEGKEYSLSYTADENGYRPVGDHLPTPPPIPPYIARALQYLATKTTPEPVTESSN